MIFGAILVSTITANFGRRIEISAEEQKFWWRSKLAGIQRTFSSDVVWQMLFTGLQRTMEEHLAFRSKAKRQQMTKDGKAIPDGPADVPPAAAAAAGPAQKLAKSRAALERLQRSVEELAEQERSAAQSLRQALKDACHALPPSCRPPSLVEALRRGLESPSREWSRGGRDDDDQSSDGSAATTATAAPAPSGGGAFIRTGLDNEEAALAAATRLRASVSRLKASKMKAGVAAAGKADTSSGGMLLLPPRGRRGSWWGDSGGDDGGGGGSSTVLPSRSRAASPERPMSPIRGAMSSPSRSRAGSPGFMSRQGSFSEEAFTAVTGGGGIAPSKVKGGAFIRTGLDNEEAALAAATRLRASVSRLKASQIKAGVAAAGGGDEGFLLLPPRITAGLRAASRRLSMAEAPVGSGSSRAGNAFGSSTDDASGSAPSTAHLRRRRMSESGLGALMRSPLSAASGAAAGSSSSLGFAEI